MSDCLLFVLQFTVVVLQLVAVVDLSQPLLCVMKMPSHVGEQWWVTPKCTGLLLVFYL